MWTVVDQYARYALHAGTVSLGKKSFPQSLAGRALMFSVAVRGYRKESSWFCCMLHVLVDNSRRVVLSELYCSVSTSFVMRSYKQRKLGKPQILCFGTVLITLS